MLEIRFEERESGAQKQRRDSINDLSPNTMSNYLSTVAGTQVVDPFLFFTQDVVSKLLSQWTWHSPIGVL